MRRWLEGAFCNTKGVAFCKRTTMGDIIINQELVSLSVSLLLSLLLCVYRIPETYPPFLEVNPPFWMDTQKQSPGSRTVVPTSMSITGWLIRQFSWQINPWNTHDNLSWSGTFNEQHFVQVGCPHKYMTKNQSKNPQTGLETCVHTTFALWCLFFLLHSPKTAQHSPKIGQHTAKMAQHRTQEGLT